MKKILFFVIALLALVSVPVMAQDSGGSDAGVVGLTTFTGIISLVSLMVTQISKLVPAIAASTLLKIGISVVAGVAASFLAQLFGLADFLFGMAWWQVLIQGLLAGLTGSGAYDIIRGLIKPSGQ